MILLGHEDFLLEKKKSIKNSELLWDRFVLQTKHTLSQIRHPDAIFVALFSSLNSEPLLFFLLLNLSQKPDCLVLGGLTPGGSYFELTHTKAWGER